MQTMLERKRLHCGDVGRKRPWQAPAQVGGPPRTCMFDAAVGDLTGECWAWEQVSYTMSVCIPEGVSLWAFLNGLVGRGPYRIRNPVPSGWQRHGAAGCEGVCVRVRLTLGKVTFLRLIKYVNYEKVLLLRFCLQQLETLYCSPFCKMEKHLSVDWLWDSVWIKCNILNNLGLRYLWDVSLEMLNNGLAMLI